VVPDPRNKLVTPGFKRPVVDEDVKTVRLLNFQPRRKRLETTDARAAFASNEHAVATLPRRIPDGVPPRTTHRNALLQCPRT
jgi:hypothetical protein